jgi:hypothetical protein
MGQPTDSGRDEQTIQQLIAQLRGEGAVAQEAGAKLVRLPAAIPALRKAAASSDAVLQQQAEPALRAALLNFNRRMVEGFPVDLFVERLLRVEGVYDEESQWCVAAEMAGKVLDHGKTQFQLKNWSGRGIEKIPVYDFLKYREQWAKYDTATPPLIIPPGQAIPLTDLGEIARAALVVRREAIETPPTRRPMVRALLVAPGTIKVDKIGASVILGGNSVIAGNCSAIMLADGDVKAEKLSGIVVTHGSVTCKSADGAILVARGTINCEIVRDSVIRQNNPKLLGWARFFEISDAGLEVAAADGGVKITSIADKQPPQKAGLRAGDVIISLDGAAIKDTEQFRRLLRRSTVQDSSKFTLRRDGKTLELTASFADWEPPALKQ